MFIGIDGNEANVKNRVGSNVYAFQLLLQLKNQMSNVKCQNQNLKVKIYLRNKPLADLPKETSFWHYEVLKPGFLWTQWRLPLELYRHKPDVFFTPGHYAPRFCPCPSVISIMDLAFLHYPEQFRKKDLYQLVGWTKYSVKNAAHIFTISQFSKREIVSFYKYPEEKISVTYPAVGNIKCQISKIKNTYQKYFLYIGTLQPRKNLIRLIEALANVNTRLIIIGKKGWMYDEIYAKVKDLGLQDRVIFSGFVSEAEKQSLLAGAIALVLPSLYEGFGIPVLEAMQAGVPVIVSRNSSLPEVAGDAAAYIDQAENVVSIQKALEKVLKLTASERKILIEKGFRQAKKFTWGKAARQTLEILINIGDEGIGN